MKTISDIRKQNDAGLFSRYGYHIALIFLSTSLLIASPPRERLLLDFNWKFRMGDDFGPGDMLLKAGVSTGPAQVKFNDANWRTVNLPHDWAVELPFDQKSDRSHGYKPVGPGYPANSIGWYRREFALSEDDRGKRIWLEFDGIYRDCRVFLNGYRLAHHESGYHSFRCDITDVARFSGKNVLAVRVDASQFEGWFYEGAGIYRHVWLVKTSPLSIAPDGIFVYTSFPKNTPGKAATLHVSSEIENRLNDPTQAVVRWSTVDPDGKIVSAMERSLNIAPGERRMVEDSASVNDPVLWSPESPRLYNLITRVVMGDKVIDSMLIIFGIRTTGFDPDKGFQLNGKPYAIRGTCNHQDHAGVGAAIPDALQKFRIAKLKDMGCNAIRTSHNAPTPELLDACDRLGMLVMDETRSFGSDEQNLSYLADQVRRDRNHPSVFIWSLANEEEVQEEAEASRIAGTMQSLVHHLDPTRFCTAAMNGWSSSQPDGISVPIDVQGFNYFHNGSMDGFHSANPSKPCIGTEEASSFWTRGIYENSATYRSAYDRNKPGYGSTAEEWVTYYAARPWASGSFAWTGFDYRGEPSPFDWPNISSEFGILDVCGFPKDVFYYYQSWWSNKTVLHLAPHWNWSGKEGKPIVVSCFSNCDEVELFLNGNSLGKKHMPVNSHIEWNPAYTPGLLSAKGYKGGIVVLEDSVETTGAPTGILLTSDRSVINADGEDLSIVTVAVVDGKGRIVPTANNHITFDLNGSGKIIGVGNGDPICHEPDVFVDGVSTRIVQLDDWRMQGIPSTSNRPEVSEEFDDSRWKPVDVRGEASQLQPETSGAYRMRISLSKEDLASDDITIHFGMIDDEGWIYVNGKLVGESHDWSQEQFFSVGRFLRAGVNTIAVCVKNHGGPGGLNKGITLEFTKKQKAEQWQRSVFNGLAQVIIQAERTAGTITLTGRSEGLPPAILVVHSESMKSRPYVE